jgi:DNA-binding beta-propeller fold protein YncE
VLVSGHNALLRRLVDMRGKTHRIVVMAMTVCAALGIARAEERASEASGTLVVSLPREHRVAFLSPSGALLGHAPTGVEPRGMTVKDGKIFVANRGTEAVPGATLTVLDAERRRAERTILACQGCGPIDLHFGPGERLFVVGQLQKMVTWLDPPWRIPAGTVVINKGWPQNIAPLGDGGTFVVSARGGDEVAFFEQEGGRARSKTVDLSPLRAAARPGRAEVWLASLQAGLFVVDREGLESEDRPARAKGLATPLDLVFHPAGDRLYLASAAKAEVGVFDAETRALLSRTEMGGAPHALEPSPEGRFLAVGVLGRGVVITRPTPEGALVEVRELGVSAPVGDILWLP